MGRYATEPGTHRGRDYDKTEREYEGYEDEEDV